MSTERELAVERLYELAISERTSRLHDWDVSDTKAGVLIALSGALLATLSTDLPTKSGAQQFADMTAIACAVVSIIYAFIAFWPKTVPGLEFDDLRQAMQSNEPEQALRDQLLILGERHREARTILNDKARARERSILWIVASLSIAVLAKIVLTLIC